MDTQNPSAPSRAQSRRRGHPPTSRAPASIHDNVRHTTGFTVIGNHLAQHRELSLLAIGLAVHIQSLPAGARVDIKTLAARFPEGGTRIAAALRELEAHGYLRRTRERLPDGRIVTRTVSYNQPGARPRPAHGHAQPRRSEPRAAPARTDGRRTAPDPPREAPPPPPRHPRTAAAATRPVPLPRPRGTASAAPAAAHTHPGAPPGRRRAPRRPPPPLAPTHPHRGGHPALAPGVAAWLERDAHPDTIRHALTATSPTPSTPGQAPAPPPHRPPATPAPRHREPQRRPPSNDRHPAPELRHAATAPSAPRTPATAATAARTQTPADLTPQPTRTRTEPHGQLTPRSDAPHLPGIPGPLLPRSPTSSGVDLPPAHLGQRPDHRPHRDRAPSNGASTPSCASRRRTTAPSSSPSRPRARRTPARPPAGPTTSRTSTTSTGCPSCSWSSARTTPPPNGPPAPSPSACRQWPTLTLTPTRRGPAQHARHHERRRGPQGPRARHARRRSHTPTIRTSMPY